MIRSLILIHALAFATGQSPPLQIGDTNQYHLVKINSDVNLSCPFKDVDFYKWNNLKTPTQLISEQKDLKIKLLSATKSEIYECEAVNGYGKRNAVFIVKGIDTTSKQFNIDCQSIQYGPCFLVSGISNDFEFTVKENSKIAMDCRAVQNSTKMDPLTYSWKKLPLSDSYETKMQNSLNNVGIKNTGQFMNDVPPIGRITYDSIDDMSKWGSIVVLKKVTKEMDGLFQCAVVGILNTIKRTFRIRVQEIRPNNTIEGPLNQTIKAAIGSTQTLYCKAPTKPKWGKQLDIADDSPESEDIIRWGGRRYKMLQGTLDLELKASGGSIRDSNYYENNLLLKNIQTSHSGIYVCTVLTSPNLEHKYVNLSVEISPGYTDSLKNNSSFSIYIAVPTTVFIICLATIIYCLIHRRIRQKANFKNRAARGAAAGTTNSSSGNGSCSGSRNTSNPRHHMLTTTTSSSKGSQNQFTPNNGFSGSTVTAPGYGPNHPTLSSGYTPVAVSYSYTVPTSYVQATNNTPSSTDIDHPCSHHNCLSHNNNCHPVPYDSDSTPSPPPPTSIMEAVSISSALNNNNPNILVPYSNNSYSPNQSSQVYMPNQTPHGSSSTSVSSPNVVYPTVQQQQQPVYPVGVMYSA